MKPVWIAVLVSSAAFIAAGYFFVGKHRKPTLDEERIKVTEATAIVARQFNFSNIQVRVPLENSTKIGISSRSLGTASIAISHNELVERLVYGSGDRRLEITIYQGQKRIERINVGSMLLTKEAALLFIKLVHERLPKVTITSEQLSE